MASDEGQSNGGETVQVSERFEGSQGGCPKQLLGAPRRLEGSDSSSQDPALVEKPQATLCRLPHKR